MSHCGQKAFDFDAWAGLARRDPARFERHRRAAIAALIEGVPAQRRSRLERLQWRIDRERERCPTAMAACVRIHSMMWQALAGEDGLLERLQCLPDPAARPQPQRATVLRFPGTRS